MRTFAILLTLACLLVPCACATGRSGIVLETDPWHQTLRIGDEVYHVTRYSRLLGPDGGPIRLHQVPSLADPGVGVRYPVRAEVDYRAREDRGRWHLDWLQVRSH